MRATNGIRTNGHRASKRESAVRELSRDEILALIDERSRFLLKISGDEFMRRYQAGTLEDSPVEAPIKVLADLVSG